MNIEENRVEAPNCLAEIVQLSVLIPIRALGFLVNVSQRCN